MEPKARHELPDASWRMHGKE